MTTIHLDNLIVDQRTQQRPLHPENVARLTDLLNEGRDFTDPIDVFHDGEHYYLAHGHHRYHAAKQAGHDHLYARINDGDLEDAIDFSCHPLNDHHGWPEDRAERERRTKRMIQRHPDWSDNRIAKHCGVSNHTVAKYREQVGNLPTSIERTGSDGKKYPAKNPKEKQPASKPSKPPEPPSVPDEPPAVNDEKNDQTDGPAEVMVDRLGHTVTDDRLREAFERESELVEMASTLSRIKRTVEKGIEAKDPLYAELHPQAVTAELVNARRQIEAIRPWTTCPYCGGEGCRGCAKRGWVSKLAYEQVEGKR